MTLDAHAHAPTLAHRALGAIIMLKVLLPMLVLSVLVYGAWQIVGGITDAIDRSRAAIEPRIADVRKQIAAVRAEGDRLLAEVEKIKNTTTQVAGAVKESVEPIRKSLLGMSGALRNLSNAIESILNAIIRVIRKVPLAPKIGLINLPDFKIPGLRLPNIDLDVDLTPDLAAVQKLNEHAQEIAAQAERGLDAVVETLRLWWWTAKAAAIMVMLWLALSLVGLGARAAQRFASGWRMVRGYRVSGALGLL